ncbi:MAG TPA: hypothetical protein VHN37_10205 [Actinomycetota bacterium]|nr:hypothetical protein [Actinomycetota bacterium]
MRKAIAALGAAALLAIPATAHAETKIGGQSGSAVGCDVTLVSFTIDPSTGHVSFDAGSANCDFEELKARIERIIASISWN